MTHTPNEQHAATPCASTSAQGNHADMTADVADVAEGRIITVVMDEAINVKEQVE